MIGAGLSIMSLHAGEFFNSLMAQHCPKRIRERIIMQNKQPSIRRNHVILHDVSGIECAFSAEDMLALQLWLYDNNVELMSMCYRPPEFMYHDRNCCTQEREQLL
jgi:hypothetical protein